MNKLEFKVVKVDPVDGTFLYIKSENETPPDQQEFYLKESKEDLKALLEDEKICQLCKQICTHGFTPVKDLKRELTGNLNISEVSFGSINKPVICSSCFDTQIFQGTVVKNSSHGQDKISNTSEGEEGASYIKTEEIEIKSEDDEDGNTSGCDDLPRESQTSQNSEVTSGTLPNDQGPALEDSSKEPTFKCDKCTYQSKYRSHLTQHQLIHKDKSKVRIYKCPRCPYETKYKCNLKKHELQHTSASETLMYTCEKCGFKTKYKGGYRQHQLRHMDPSQVPMYDCEKCSFQTKYKNCLVKHRLLHKNAARIETYKCNNCDYETRYKSYLALHQRVHNTASDEEMFKCDHCDYRVRYKKLFERHQMMHVVVPRVMFKCDKCKYETKLESNLKLHQIGHRVYKCGACAYESERKEDIVRHRVIHDGQSGDQTRE